MALQPSLPSRNPSHERSFRQLSARNGPGSGANNALAQINAAQLLPRGIHSLYAQNPGALLGSGQAAGMALGAAHTHNSLSSGLNSSSGPMAGGAAQYLAGLGMSMVLPPSLSYVVSGAVKLSCRRCVSMQWALNLLLLLLVSCQEQSSSL